MTLENESSHNRPAKNRIRVEVSDHKFTTEEERVLRSLAAGLQAREIEDVLLDPEDASIAVYVQSALSKLGLSTKRELLQYARERYREEVLD